MFPVARPLWRSGPGRDAPEGRVEALERRLADAIRGGEALAGAVEQLTTGQSAAALAAVDEARALFADDAEGG